MDSSAERPSDGFAEKLRRLVIAVVPFVLGFWLIALGLVLKLVS